MNKLSLIQQIQRFFKLESAGGILLLFFSGSRNAISQFTAQSNL